MLKENLAEFPPPRKPPGTLFSAKLRVKVNFFEISFDMRSPTKYQYDIKIEPPRPKGFFYMIVETFMANHFPGRFYAYDGNQILYTGHPLGDGLHQPMTAEITINDHDRQSERNYSVTIKFSADIDMSVLHEKMLQQKSLEDNRIVNARTCLQIIFRGNSARYNVIQRGRAFFHPTREINIGKGKVIKPGIGHTVVLGSKPFLNLDMIYQIFPKSGNVIDSIIHEVCGPAPRPNNPPQRINLSLGLKDWQKKDLEEFVKGLRVEVKLPEGPILRRSPVKGLADCSSRNWFEKEGKKITVQQHFLEFYRYRIQNSELPCVWFGSEDKKYCYPIELCVILPNQSKKFRNTDSDIRAIGNEATCTTQQREEKIKEAANVINIKPSNEYLADFGVEVSGEFKKVDSRILIHPKLGYRSSIVEVNKGQWEPGIFRGAKSLSRWCIVVFDDYVNSDHVEKFKRNFISWGKKLGMTIDDINPDRHVIYERADVRENDMKNLFKYCLEKYDDDIQLMLVVLPMRNTKEVRSRVKILCEIQSKVLTSCIKASTFQRADGSILKNLFLKINSKLAGVNHIVSPVPRPEGTNQGYIQGRTMVLGADVTHTAPQDRQKIPSVAAVVASYDEHASLYSMEWTFQNPSITEHEIIQDLKEMVINHLKFYKTKNDGVTPERLFFFRDGVSEGEFDKVRFKELRAIRDACQDICGKFIPLTFIIVQKRHRTRFIPDPENQDEKKTIYDRKNNNVPAGTVVDKVIVRQDMFEFYLVSHASLLGTARPTKYKTILDECNISADELEHLTYYLCHMFNRCSRSVSYPAPTYYAHLACKRIRDYLLTERVNMSNLKAEERRLKGDQEFYLNNPLYFI